MLSRLREHFEYQVMPPETADRDAAPAVLLYTSGSTGKPKGILHSMDSFAHAMTAESVIMAGLPRGKSFTMASFSFVVSLVEIFTPLFWNGSEDYIPGTLLGILIFTGDYSFFPLFGAVCVPIIGYAAGLWLDRHSEDPRKAELRIGLLSLAVLAVTAPFSHMEFYDNFGDYFVPLHQTLFHLGICGALMTLPRFPANRFFRWLDRASSLIMPFYMIHWVLVSCCGVLLYMIVPVVGPEYLAYAAAISVLSYLLATKYGAKLMGML